MIFCIGYLYLNVFKDAKRTEYVTELSGTVKKTNQTKGTTFVLLDNEKKYRSIDASYNYDYYKPFIADFLKEGDILKKNKCSDTLYITRQNKKYHFIIGDVLYNSKSHTQEYILHWNKQRRIIKEKTNCK